MIYTILYDTILYYIISACPPRTRAALSTAYFVYDPSTAGRGE